MIHIGFTGTQEGMTAFQKERVFELLQYKDFWGHHGDCIGADAEFDAIARSCKSFRWMHIHPCTITKKRAFCTKLPYDVVNEPLPPLDRNKVIVTESYCMIATPKEAFMQLRSGTWSTVRFALLQNKPTAIILPNGALIYDGSEWPV